MSIGTSPVDADSDYDGWTDGDEVNAGNDPLDPTDHPTAGGGGGGGGGGCSAGRGEPAAMPGSLIPLGVLALVLLATRSLRRRPAGR